MRSLDNMNEKKSYNIREAIDVILKACEPFHGLTASHALMAAHEIIEHDIRMDREEGLQGMTMGLSALTGLDIKKMGSAFISGEIPADLSADTPVPPPVRTGLSDEGLEKLGIKKGEA